MQAQAIADHTKENAGIYLIADGKDKALVVGQTEDLLDLILRFYGDNNHCIWSHSPSGYYVEAIADEAERQRCVSEMIKNLQPVCN